MQRILKRYQPVFALAALSLVTFVSGCAHTKLYTEPPLAESEVAVLEVAVPVWIMSIDGEEVSYDLTEVTKKLKIAPGPHSVQVWYRTVETRTGRLYGIERMEWRRVSGQNYVQLNLVAKPGHTYSITGHHSESKWWASITDFLTMSPPDPGK